MKTWILALGLVTLLAGATSVSAAPSGEAFFKAKCANCHAAGKKFPLAGVSKKGYSDQKLTEMTFTTPPKGMPKVKASAEEQKAVIDYVKTL